MIIKTDSRSGFCFGVRNAVKIAETALEKGEKVYSLGSIVHNDAEVERLNKLGLITISHEEFLKLKNAKVLLRAHGEPPETYDIAARNNITIIEATCPIVKKLQIRIKESWKKSMEDGSQVVIFGKPGHAEVRGLMGQTENNAIVVSGFSDLDKIDFNRPVVLYSQTTMGLNEYASLADEIRKRFMLNGSKDPDNMLKVRKTICAQVSDREPHLREFAAQHDVIIFVSGKESSNGKMLFSICLGVNPSSYFISKADEIMEEWFRGKKSAGICGATSTPGWLIDEARKKVESFNN